MRTSARRVVAAMLGALSLASATVASAAVQPPRAAAPLAAANLLDHTALLNEVGGRSWFESNVPFVELPDTEIQRVYYYRFDTLRRAFKSTRPGTGHVVNEFQPPVFWSAQYGGIALNPWHNNRDGRWLRATRSPSAASRSSRATPASPTSSPARPRR
ncbi:hypothetical protein AB0J72_23645 [Dactylosporangium sp. NPDC049742]|uniref:hypothetical protein n=1 Tax=Dactylosporangium sp. NPDC049742 TaxID=3154737 RepID=UPI003426AAEB